MVYLQDIKLTNFKCFEETSTLDFGKLTLLTGANSTGKSSLMYGILGVLQSEEFPLRFSPNGNYVQMGNFLEMVFKHDSGKDICVAFTLVDSETNENLHMDTQWRCDSAGNPQLKRCDCEGDFFHYVVVEADDSGKLILNLDVDPSKGKKKSEIESLLKYVNSEAPSDVELVRYLRYATKESHIKDFKVGSFSSDTKEEVRYPFLFVLHETMSMIRRYNDNVNYISSYRQPAQRVYAEERVTSGKISTSGEGFINELLRWKDDSQDKFAQFVDAMKTIGLLSDIEPTRLGAGQFKVDVRVNDADGLANLSDVGFGISQAMPIIIGDVELSKGSTLYISQPEVHLHPSAQAKLGDYLVKQINHGKRYVMETHSEYLMNRLRLSIVRGTIAEDDVKVYYMRQEGGKTHIHKVKFKKNGQVEGAPQDFFDTYMIDVMDIAMSVR